MIAGNHRVAWSTFYKRLRVSAQTPDSRARGTEDLAVRSIRVCAGLSPGAPFLCLPVWPDAGIVATNPGLNQGLKVAHDTRAAGLGRGSLLWAALGSGTRRSLTKVPLGRNRATQRPGRPAEHAPPAPSGLLGSTGAAQGSGDWAPPGRGPRPAPLLYWAGPELAGARRAKEEGGREPRAAEGGGEDPAQSVRTGRELEVGHGAAAPGPVSSAPAAE